jgi:hypothetical protein
MIVRNNAISRSRYAVRMADTTKSGNLWRRGDRLLVLSRQAREQGHNELADDILDRAVQLLEDARVIEGLSEMRVVRLAS